MTPKEQQFNKEIYADNTYLEILKRKLMDKITTLEHEGAKLVDNNSYAFRYFSVSISAEDLAKFKESKKAEVELLKLFNSNKEEKIKNYNSLKNRLDFCLHDVKSYKQLCSKIDQLSYCNAISELQDLNKRYIKSKAPSKFIYRSRNAEFSKIQC
jgi:hypothetical protein